MPPIVSLPPAAPPTPTPLTGPYSLNLGTVTTLAPGANATVSLTGAYGSQVLSFGIPQGVAGPSYTLPAATSSTLGGVTTSANITNTSGAISITAANVNAALGYTAANA